MRKPSEFVAAFQATPPDRRQVIVCRACGSARVDHLSRLSIACRDCHAEGAMPAGFALIRNRYAVADVLAATIPRAVITRARQLVGERRKAAIH